VVRKTSKYYQIAFDNLMSRCFTESSLIPHGFEYEIGRLAKNLSEIEA
jgi:hypothetical protein